MSNQAAIIVVNYGSHELVKRNIPGDMPPELIVVIVDNFSSKSERAAVESLCRQRGWHLESHENIGFGAGVNRGVDRASALGCDRYLIVNPDLAADTDTLVELARRAAEDPTTMHGPTIMTPQGSIWFAGGSVRVAAGITTTSPGSDASAPGGWLTGACLAIHRDLWAAAGGFDDDYFLYWEDVDLSWRVTAADGRLKVWPDLVVVHDVGGTQSGGGKSPTYVYYNCRNRLLFAHKHLSKKNQLRWLVRTPTYARRVALRGGKRAFYANAPRLVWAAVRGSLNGIWHVLGGMIAPRPQNVVSR